MPNKASDPVELKKAAIVGSTQGHLPIEDIRDGVVVMKDGSAAAIIQLASVNFDLLSGREQEALVFAYGGILNSLTFPVQIMIRSAIKDVSVYVAKLRDQEEKLANPLLKDKIRSYRAFVQNVVQQNKVLAKSFYVVVPFSTLELGVVDSASSMFPKMPGKKKINQKLPSKVEYILEKAKLALEPKKEHIIRLFARLGLLAKPLSTKELIQLFYEIYNEEAGGQKVQVTNYTAPIVTTPKINV